MKMVLKDGTQYAITSLFYDDSFSEEKLGNYVNISFDLAGKTNLQVYLNEIKSKLTLDNISKVVISQVKEDGAVDYEYSFTKVSNLRMRINEYGAELELVLVL